MDLKALLNKHVTAEREAKAARDEQLLQGRDHARSFLVLDHAHP